MQADSYIDSEGNRWNKVGNQLYRMVSYELTGHICAPTADCIECGELTPRDKLHIHIKSVLYQAREMGLCSEGCLINYLQGMGAVGEYTLAR